MSEFTNVMIPIGGETLDRLDAEVASRTEQFKSQKTEKPSAQPAINTREEIEHAKTLASKHGNVQEANMYLRKCVAARSQGVDHRRRGLRQPSRVSTIMSILEDYFKSKK